MKRPLIRLFIGLLVSIAPIGLPTASAEEAKAPGYEWAEANHVDDMSDCDGHSGSFREGCEEYVEERSSKPKKSGS